MAQQLYEAMFLVDSALGDQGLPGAIRHIADLLGRYDVQFERIEKWSEQDLAYPIERVKRGVYILCFFRADTSKVADIRRVVNISEQILRTIILVAESVPPAGDDVYDKNGEPVELPDSEEEPVASGAPQEDVAEGDAQGDDGNEKG